MIIGLVGHKRSGKDTVAAYLVKAYGFERRAYADPLKFSIAQLFGISYSDVDIHKLDPSASVQIMVNGVCLHKHSFREFLQRYGTEAHRNVFGTDFWLDHTLPVGGYYAGRNIVVTDCRFPNEAQRITDIGGHLWRVDRPRPLEPVDTHTSETQLNLIKPDVVLENASSLEDLYHLIDEQLSK